MLPVFVLLAGCDGPTTDSADSGADADSGAVDSLPGDSTADTEEDTGGGGDDTADDAAEEAAYEAFYDEATIRQVVIEISAEDMAEMDREARRAYAENPSNPELSYFPADITIDGERIEDVGIRLKGSSTFQYWEDKPSLKIKFDELVEGQRFAGLKRATFNNMTGDPAMCREVIGYHFWRELGMAVPRATFAQLSVVVDGEPAEPFGLYTNLEAYDSEWVERNYTEDEGDLWEGNDSADFSRRGISHFELVTGPGDADALDDARDQVQNHGDDFYADVNDVLDMESFLDFWTLSIAIGNRDGYPFNLNDYYIYRDPADERFDFMPWGMDESWDTATPKYASYVSGSIAQFCLYYDATCPGRYSEALSQNVALYEAADLGTFAAEMQALTAEAMADDPRKNYGGWALTPAQVEQYRAALNYRIEMYPQWLRNNLDIE